MLRRPGAQLPDIIYRKGDVVKSSAQQNCVCLRTRSRHRHSVLIILHQQNNLVNSFGPQRFIMNHRLGDACSFWKHLRPFRGDMVMLPPSRCSLSTGPESMVVLTMGESGYPLKDCAVILKAFILRHKVVRPMPRT